MSSLVFAGSSQIVLCQLLANSAPLAVVFLTISVINLRHVLYSASLAASLWQLSPWWKIVLSYFLTDEAYATSIGYLHKADGSLFKYWFLLGTGVGLWSCWQISTLAGILLGQQIPASWGLDFAIPLTFIALVVPNVKTRADWAAVAVSGAAAVLFFALPFKLSLLAATACGVAIGVWLMKRREA
jgi:predicted branched-subunit amino acid permease